MRSYLILILLATCSLKGIAKTELRLRFKGSFNGNPLSLATSDTAITNPTNTRITKVRFYISHVELYQDGRCVYRDKAPGHLIDLSDSAKSEVRFTTRKEIVFSEVRFLIGIDSATSMKGIEKGDLDPSNEMYWSWQSGYINFKLEGYSPLCIKERPKTEFHYHIGGYHFYENTCNEVRLNIASSNTIHIDLHLEQVLQEALLREVAHVQLPGTKAASIATSFAHCFFIH